MSNTNLSCEQDLAHRVHRVTSCCTVNTAERLADMRVSVHRTDQVHLAEKEDHTNKVDLREAALGHGSQASG